MVYTYETVAVVRFHTGMLCEYETTAAKLIAEIKWFVIVQCTILMEQSADKRIACILLSNSYRCTKLCPPSCQMSLFAKVWNYHMHVILILIIFNKI